jgi:uncharacterized membrane protein
VSKEPVRGPSFEQQAAWGFPSQGESRIPAALAVVAALLLYVLLPNRLTVGPNWLLPSLEVALLIPLIVANPARLTRESRNLRWLSLALIALVSLANVTSLSLLVHFLLRGGKAGGRQLIYAAIGIWLTNVLVFALWYWELDRGGPLARVQPEHRPPDLLFPQMSTPWVVERPWYPQFLDYLYTSLTNATAFSPTDTMPLTPSAKILFGAQSLISLMVIVVVGARAVNILS